MFAITADQVGSRSGPDLVETALADLAALAGERLVLPAERTAGDELQAVTGDPKAALAVVLHLTRSGRFSVGLGIGDVDAGAVATTRALTGSALVHARAAVEAAKRRATRIAVVADDDLDLGADVLQPLLDLLVALRARRSEQGWELYDLVRDGGTQGEAAQRLGITAQAASKRAIAAGVRLDLDAQGALSRLLSVAGGRVSA